MVQNFNHAKIDDAYNAYVTDGNKYDFNVYN